eukprot:scaffold602_cov342-Prasinococcus_capsulatus_cf.AAC.2
MVARSLTRRCARRYCVPGTVGYQLLGGQRVVKDNRGAAVRVQMQVQQYSFSAHTDARGIMDLLKQVGRPTAAANVTCARAAHALASGLVRVIPAGRGVQTCPRAVMLVHGEAAKMEVLRQQVAHTLGVAAHAPPNGTPVVVPERRGVPVALSASRRFDCGGAKRPRWLAEEGEHPAHLEARALRRSGDDDVMPRLRLEAIGEEPAPHLLQQQQQQQPHPPVAPHAVRYECAQDLREWRMTDHARTKLRRGADRTEVEETPEAWRRLLRLAVRQFAAQLGLDEGSSSSGGDGDDDEMSLLLRLRSLRLRLEPPLRLVATWEHAEGQLAMHLLSLLRSYAQ